MPIAKFVISLDFELFWGVGDTQTIAGYGRNVLGVWQAIPRLLAMFRRDRIRATWATVGMLMCRDIRQWRGIRPALLPGYAQSSLSAYRLDSLASENPRLFFARPLVEQILAAPGQELATHTYSHFYCNEPGATPEQFAADLACARYIAADMGAAYRSIVLPRNQVIERFLAVLPEAGIDVFRGNDRHWLYCHGDAVIGGLAGRMVRYADACLPLSGPRSVRERRHGSLVDVPASLFLYPWSAPRRALLGMRLQRIKAGMNAAARQGSVFHLWWHPHNFGANLDENLTLLDAVLRHYRVLADTHGMQSRAMADFGPSVPAAGRGASGAAHANQGAPR